MPLLACIGTCPAMPRGSERVLQLHKARCLSARDSAHEDCLDCEIDLPSNLRKVKPSKEFIRRARVRSQEQWWWGGGERPGPRTPEELLSGSCGRASSITAPERARARVFPCGTVLGAPGRASGLDSARSLPGPGEGRSSNERSLRDCHSVPVETARHGAGAGTAPCGQLVCMM